MYGFTTTRYTHTTNIIEVHSLHVTILTLPTQLHTQTCLGCFGAVFHPALKREREMMVKVPILCNATNTHIHYPLLPIPLSRHPLQLKPSFTINKVGQTTLPCISSLPLQPHHTHVLPPSQLKYNHDVNTSPIIQPPNPNLPRKPFQRQAHKEERQLL